MYQENTYIYGYKALIIKLHVFLYSHFMTLYMTNYYTIFHCKNMK
jgi:hypothetical protein